MDQAGILEGPPTFVSASFISPHNQWHTVSYLLAKIWTKSININLLQFTIYGKWLLGYPMKKFVLVTVKSYFKLFNLPFTPLCESLSIKPLNMISGYLIDDFFTCFYLMSDDTEWDSLLPDYAVNNVKYTCGQYNGCKGCL